jgi:hypothetical protein
VAFNTEPVDQRKPRGTDNALVELVFQTSQACFLTPGLFIRAVVPEEPILADTGPLAVVVGVFDTVYTVVVGGSSTTVAAWVTGALEGATVVSSPPLKTYTTLVDIEVGVLDALSAVVVCWAEAEALFALEVALPIEVVAGWSVPSLAADALTIPVTVRIGDACGACCSTRADTGDTV